MPIHLAPISRRRFLTRSLVAGAGIALNPNFFAAEKPADANLRVLLADTHIAANRAQISRGVNMSDHLSRVVRELTALPERPAAVLIIGDCAYNSGQKGDYGTLTGLLDPLRQARMPVHLALGNHDNRERFWAALQQEKAAARPLADRQAALLRTPLANWFILDSLERTLSTPGLLGPEQLGWLARTLDSNRERPALLLIHHNPGTRDTIEGLKDTDALLQIIRPRNQVKAYIFGHTHDWHVARDESGMHLVNLPPVAYVFQDGKPSGWAKATLRADGMTLELRCADPSHEAQGQIVDLTWRS